MEITKLLERYLKHSLKPLAQNNLRIYLTNPFNMKTSKNTKVIINPFLNELLEIELLMIEFR